MSGSVYRGPAGVHQAPDPVTVTVIHYAFLAAAEEMKTALQKSAFNHIVNEMHDFSVAVFDAQGETIAQAPGLPSFLCDIPSAIRAVADDIGGMDQFQPQDVYMTNDPHRCTNHVPDVTVIQPVFLGPRRVGFVGTRAHWQDIGGASGGSGFTAQEVFQEGIVYPSVQICAAGQLRSDILRIIEANSRLPEAVAGDLRAQMGACRVGEQRFLDIVQRFGLATVEEAVTLIFRGGERLATERIRALRPGTYSAEGWLDHDGLDLTRPIHLVVSVTVADGRLHVDLSGSSPRSLGAINSNRETATSTIRFMMKILTTPNEPANEGHFRPLEVVIPSGSVLDAQWPSATVLGFYVLKLLEDVFKSALVQAAPELVNAHDYGKCDVCMIKSRKPGGGYLIYPDTEGGGMGASVHGDGESAIKGHDTVVISLELTEARYPLRATQYRLRPDSGGPGERRGGLGIIKEYECLDEVWLGAGFDRILFPPQGILGGGAGVANRMSIVMADGSELRSVTKVSDHLVHKGERIRIETAGGGGWGNPMHRSLVAVQEDLLEGLVSAEAAARDYGVRVRSETAEIDQDLTTAERRRRSGRL